MKVNKKELYSVDDLTKEELLFILEVIEKLQLAPDSTPEAHMAAKKFKQFRAEMLGSLQETSSDLICDGCETTINVTDQLCPIERVNKPLCHKCLVHREDVSIGWSK
jgi:hypothetical protein